MISFSHLESTSLGKNSLSVNIAMDKGKPASCVCFIVDRSVASLVNSSAIQLPAMSLCPGTQAFSRALVQIASTFYDHL